MTEFMAGLASGWKKISGKLSKQKAGGPAATTLVLHNTLMSKMGYMFWL